LLFWLKNSFAQKESVKRCDVVMKKPILLSPNFREKYVHIDRLCGLVVRVLGYRSECRGLERGPLSLVSKTEELLDRKVAVPV
jgi:hypothetical protein